MPHFERAERIGRQAMEAGAVEFLTKSFDDYGRTQACEIR